MTPEVIISNHLCRNLLFSNLSLKAIVIKFVVYTQIGPGKINTGTLDLIFGKRTKQVRTQFEYKTYAILIWKHEYRVSFDF